MKASYLNDTQKGPGRGFLSVTEAGDLAFPEDIRFGIKRASDRSCLGKGGWQSAEIFLQPLGAFSAGEGITLAVGPDVVDNLDPRETYRLMLLQADGSSAVCSLQVREVAYSVLRDEGGTGAVPGREQEPEESKAEPPPAEEEQSATPEPAPAGPESLPAPDAAPEAANLRPLAPPAPGTRKKPKGLLLAGLLLLVLAGGGIAAWKILSDGQPDPETAPPQAEAQPGAVKEPGADAPSLADKKTEEKPPAETRSPLTRAREHLAGSADPAEGIRIAKELRDAEGGADAAFLLAEDAAGKGDAEAMLLTGNFYDPANSAPSGSIVKDAEQALYWYQQASRAGLAEAKANLAALRTWLEAEAAKGSADARALLERF
jgi:hypothetical protein